MAKTNANPPASPAPRLVWTLNGPTWEAPSGRRPGRMYRVARATPQPPKAQELRPGQAFEPEPPRNLKAAPVWTLHGSDNELVDPDQHRHYTSAQAARDTCQMIEDALPAQ